MSTFRRPSSARSSTRPRGVTATATVAAGCALLVGLLAAGTGCGEQPEPGASRATDGPREGGSRSTLGRARDRAESVIQDVEEYDQRRMDMIDEMNGVDPAERATEDPPSGEDDG